MKISLNAVSLRWMLSTALVLTLTGIGGGFYIAYTTLEKSAQATANAQSEAESSDANLSQLIITKRQLEENKDVVVRAKQIVAESQGYQYQNQIINDLSFYASELGLSINSFSFQGDSAEQAPATPAQPTVPDGKLKSTVVTIELAGNLTYESTLRYIHKIEQNITRMQVSNVALTGTAQPNQSGGASQSLNIEVYIK